MRKTIIALMMMGLTACGGGGGGSGAPSLGSNTYGCTDPAATNYNLSATIDDGSCFYGGGTGGGTSGNASYYGFSTGGSEIANTLMEPSSLYNIVVTNEMYVEVKNKTTRDLDVAIYQPTCPMSSALYYSAVLLTNSGGAQAVTVFVNTYANTMKVTSHAFAQQSVPSIVMSRYDVDAGTDISFTCASGTITATDGTQIYANGKTLVMKKGSNLWLGFAQTTLDIASPNTLQLYYDSYNQIDATGYALGALNPNGSTFGQGGGNEALNSTGFNLYNGLAHTYFGDGSFRKYGNQMSDDSSHALIIDGSYTGAVATALVANYSGTRVLLMATPASYTTIFFSGKPADYYVGTGALSLGIGQ